MTALELYREDRKNRKIPEGRRSRQEYFSLLRDTLHDELMRDGRSDFLEAMIADCTGGKPLPVLEFAALRECVAMVVDDRGMQDATICVPHIRKGEDEPLTWQELESGPSFRVDDPQLPGMLRRLRTVSSQMVNLRDETVIPQAERAAQRDIDGLKALGKLLEEDNAALRKERDELRERLAEMEEGIITRQLQMKMEVRRRQEEARLAQELAHRRETAERELRQSLSAMAAREQERRIAADLFASERAAERAAEYAALQSGVQERLQALQEQLAGQLEDWRSSMHASDHRFLAASFASLEGAVRRLMPEIMADAQMSCTDERLHQGLTELNATLDAQLRQLEQALLHIGLRLYRPQRGEPFDSRLHSPVSASAQDAPEEEAVIDRVETPGVLRLLANGTETLVRAVVHTTSRGQEAQE